MTEKGKPTNVESATILWLAAVGGSLALIAGVALGTPDVSGWAQKKIWDLSGGGWQRSMVTLLLMYTVAAVLLMTPALIWTIWTRCRNEGDRRVLTRYVGVSTFVFFALHLTTDGIVDWAFLAICGAGTASAPAGICVSERILRRARARTLR